MTISNIWELDSHAWRRRGKFTLTKGRKLQRQGRGNTG